MTRQSDTAINLFLLIRLNWKLYIKIQFLIKNSGLTILKKIEGEWHIIFCLSGVLKSNFRNARLLAGFQIAYTLFEDTNWTHFLSPFSSQKADSALTRRLSFLKIFPKHNSVFAIIVEAFDYHPPPQSGCS